MVLPAAETFAINGVPPTEETDQVVCPKTMRRIPKNYVPCVFLGQRDLVKNSKCPAKGCEGSLLAKEQSSRGSAELNNNSQVNRECQQWSDATKSSKEVLTGGVIYSVVSINYCKQTP